MATIKPTTYRDDGKGRPTIDKDPKSGRSIVTTQLNLKKS